MNKEVGDIDNGRQSIEAEANERGFNNTSGES